MTSVFGIRKSTRVRGAALITASQAILIALGFVTHVIIGRIGGPSLYGVYGVVLSLMTIVNMILALGIPVATSKETAEDEENSGGVFVAALRLQIAFSLLLSVGTLFLADAAAAILRDPKLALPIRFSALIYPSTALYSLLSNYFNGLHAFGAQSRLTIIYAVTKLAGSVGLLAAFRSVPAALSGFITGGLTATAIGLRQALPTVRGRVRRPVPARRLFVFAGSFMGMSIALQLLMSLDLFLVKRLLSDDAVVGYYNAAATVSRMPYFILQGLGFVFLPSVARLFAEDAARARAFIREVFRYLFLILLPVTVFAATTSKALLRLVFFSTQYDPAAPPLTILSLALGLLSGFYLLSTIAAGASRPRIPLAIAWGLIPLAGGLGLFLIPRAHLVGAAAATTIAAAAGLLALGWYMYRRFHLTFPALTLGRGLAATTVATLPTYFVTPPTLALPLWYLLLFLAYGLTLVALGEIRREDWGHVRRLFRRTPATTGEL